MSKTLFVSQYRQNSKRVIFYFWKFLFFLNVPGAAPMSVRKILVNHKLNYHKSLSDTSCLQKRIVMGSFGVSECSWYRKTLLNEKMTFFVFIFLSHSNKIFVGKPFCNSKSFCLRENFWITRVFTILCQNFFVQQNRKFLWEGPLYVCKYLLVLGTKSSLKF